MFVEGKSRTVFFPSDTLIYSISRDGSKNYNIRTCEHMILGQLWMGARQTNYAPLKDNQTGLIHDQKILSALPNNHINMHTQIPMVVALWCGHPCAHS